MSDNELKNHSNLELLDPVRHDGIRLTLDASLMDVQHSDNHRAQGDRHV